MKSRRRRAPQPHDPTMRQVARQASLDPGDGIEL
jgi:hypothetical protein